MLKQARLWIKGDVVGVGFRAWVKIIASQCGGVVGWARNAYNNPSVFGKRGGVEVVVQGENNDISSFIDTIASSPNHKIDGVEVFEEDVKEIYDDFEIKKSSLIL